MLILTVLVAMVALGAALGLVLSRSWHDRFVHPRDLRRV